MMAQSILFLSEKRISNSLYQKLFSLNWLDLLSFECSENYTSFDCDKKIQVHLLI